MFFVGMALLVAVGLSFLIASDAGTLIGLEQDQFGSLVAMVAVLVLVAGGTFGRRVRLNEIVAGSIMWVGIFALVIFGYSYRTDLERYGSRLISQLSPGTAYVSESGDSVRFTRSMSGSFVVNGSVNEAKTRFIFDTGATSVVLTVEDAQRAGIDIKRLSYIVPVRTANGETEAALTRLNRIEVGGIVRENIPALVAQRGQLETSLLGMTYLETLSSFTVSKDALELKD